MYSKLPPLNQLRGFEAAARLGSFKAAGEELNLTATAISHQISKLEDQLGILLFERQIRSVALTEEGALLAQAAHQAFSQLSSTLETISDTKLVLRISTTSSFASMWLVPNLDSFQKKHPEIQVEIKTGEDTIDINRDRRVDLAIRYGRHPDNAQSTTNLVTEDFGAYATESYLTEHPDLEGAVFIETKLKNKNLPTINWANWLEKFRHNISPSKVKSFDQEQHAIQAALAGQGVVLTSSVLANMAIKQGWLSPVSDSQLIPGLTYYLLTSPHSENLHKTIAFKEWLLEELDGF